MKYETAMSTLLSHGIWLCMDVDEKKKTKWYKRDIPTINVAAYIFALVIVIFLLTVFGLFIADMLQYSECDSDEKTEVTGVYVEMLWYDDEAPAPFRILIYGQGCFKYKVYRTMVGGERVLIADSDNWGDPSEQNYYGYFYYDE